ncbi:ankyrin repeat-containing domain protein [Aspergillus stella-maris]|uniref:ankyrin repeat-containing domain protein n=1 Tax=Aspergillus stella-maris TaxID=1810926 RepID=UPI003CCD1B6E
MAENAAPLDSLGLPVELIQSITHYLPGPSLCAFAKTSRRVKDVASWHYARDKGEHILVWKLTELHRSKYHRPPNPEQWQPYKLLVDACRRGVIEYERTHLDDNTLPKDWWQDLGFRFAPFSPLDAAAQTNHHEIMQLLLRAETEGLHRKYREPQICLLLTADPDDEAIGLLVRHGERIGIDWKRHYLSSYAAENQLPVSAILKLMRHEPWSDNWRPTYPTPCTPFGHALQTKEGTSHERQEEIVRVLLLDSTKLDRSCEIEDGYYPVHMAAGYGSEGILRMILHDFHADPNKPTVATGQPPLDLAIRRRIRGEYALDKVQILLQTGARPDSLTFEVALEYASPEIVQIIWDTWKVRDATASSELLIGAATVGDIEVLQKLLPLCLSGDNEECLSTALQKAVQFKRDLAIEALLGPETSILMTHPNIHKILSTTLVHEIVDTLKRVLASSASQEIESLHDRKLMCAAIEHQPLEILSTILKRIRRQFHSENIAYILDTMAMTGDKEALSLFLNHIDPGEANMQARQEFWFPSLALINPLATATFHNHPAVAKGLMKWCLGYKIHEQTDESTLAVAISANNSLIVQALLDAGAEFKAHHETINVNGFAETVKVLLAHDYRANLECRSRQTAPAVKLFLVLGLLNKDSYSEESPWLVRAVKKNCHDVVRVLVEAGFDVTKADNDGNTPLHVAEDDEMVKILYSKR